MANYQVDGNMVQYSIDSNPSLFFSNNGMAAFLSGCTLKYKKQKDNIITADFYYVDLLTLLGDDGLTMKIKSGDEVLYNQTFTKSDVTLGLVGFPAVQTGTYTIEITDLAYDNTYLGITPLISFSFSQNIHIPAFTYNGQFAIDTANVSISQMYANGFSSPSIQDNNSILYLLQHISIITDNLEEYRALDIAQYGFKIRTNRASFPTDYSIIGASPTITRSLAYNTFFRHANVDNETTTITITLLYYDTSTNTDREVSFSFDITIIGVVSFNASALETFVEQNASAGMFSTRCAFSNGIGIVDLPNSYENYWNNISYNFHNDNTGQDISLGSYLGNGVYTASVGLVINPDWTLTATTTLKIYASAPSSLTATLLKESYRVGYLFKDTQIVLYANYLIYGSEYEKKRIYYPNFSSNYNNVRFTSDDYPSATITVSYGNLTTQVIAYTYYNVNDNLYVFDKNTFVRSLYGEIQQGFNMNLVTDGTKDNTKVTLLNFTQEDVKPFTIAYLESTDSWWIVKEDKVTRYDSEENAMYQHDITLLGAFEILNARDLVGCGFNVNKYTINQLFNRLIKLTDFELPVEFDYDVYVNPNKIVDYLKTFENYTPASAIKEICDGMNLTPKMYFGFDEETQKINRAIIYFIPNSGTNEQTIDISTFDDSQETITSDKENYGSKVVSNIQNVVSGKVIRYPAVGTVHISSNQNKVTYSSAMLRLPSKANYVESLEIYGRVALTLKIGSDDTQYFVSNGDIFSSDAINSVYQQALTYISYYATQYGSPYDTMRDKFIEDEEKIKEYIRTNGFLKLENGADYAQIDKNNGWSGEWNGKQVELAFNGNISDQVSGHPGIGPLRSNSIGLNDKKHYDVFPQPVCMVYWEQGNDLIRNFEFFDKFTPTQDQFTTPKIPYFVNGNYGGGAATIGLEVRINLTSTYEATYVVNYIPMSDMKLKTENGIFNNDTHLYNQNGKLIACKAISKLINSHADTISSNQITRYKRYYDFFSIPQVGQVVDNGGVNYIINNVSVDFYENDNNNYVYDCQFTMTRQIACKSTMISANTNIRDYDTPQNNNVYRIQNYRDVIYLSYENETSSSYMPLNDLFNLPNAYTFGVNKGYVDTHTAIMKIRWAENNTNYYQLPSIKYELEKMIVEIIDFKDNNIIGYAVQNTTHPFQVSSWWVTSDLIQTPVSYVDSAGHLIDIDIKMCDNNQLTSAYQVLETQYQLDITSLYSASCIIPEELYNSVNYDTIIEEDDYDKDGLEIPMFIYSCQALNRNDFVFASDFLNEDYCSEDEFICYGYKVVDERITEENAISLIPSADLPYVENGILNMPYSLYLIKNVNNLSLGLHINRTWDIANNTFNQISYYAGDVVGKNIVIYYCMFNRNGQRIKTNFLFGINNCKRNAFALALYECSKKL